MNNSDGRWGFIVYGSRFGVLRNWRERRTRQAVKYFMILEGRETEIR